MVPNLPYFMVQFDHKGEKGYGHVIEGSDAVDGEDPTEEGEKGGGDFPRYARSMSRVFKAHTFVEAISRVRSLAMSLSWKPGAGDVQEKSTSGVTRSGRRCLKRSMTSSIGLG